MSITSLFQNDFVKAKKYLSIARNNSNLKKKYYRYFDEISNLIKENEKYYYAELKRERERENEKSKEESIPLPSKQITSTTQPVKDSEEEILHDYRDGNKYKTAIIGDDIWMVENLKYLPVVQPLESKNSIYIYDYNGWSVTQAKATNNYKQYGALYSYEMAKTACPSGWKLPSDEQWQKLIDNLGEYSEVINIQFSGCATLNPRNYRSINVLGFYWSGTKTKYNERYVAFDESGSLIGDGIGSLWGFSVRCIKE